VFGDNPVVSMSRKHTCALEIRFAIAGPVKDGRVATTNLAWIVDAARLARQLDLRAIALINDLEAIGHGLPELAAGDLATLAAGEPGICPMGALLAPVARSKARISPFIVRPITESVCG